MPIDKKNKVLLNRLIQFIVIAGVAVFVYFKIIQREVSFSFEIIRLSFDDHPFLWVTILLLMPLNWLLEMIKWQKLCKPVENISLKTAAAGVLSGLSISFITPHGWGDYLGRILILKNKERGKLVGALFFGRITQLFITVFAGILGIIMYVETWPFFYLWYFLILFLIALFIGFNKSIYRIIKPYLLKVKYFFKIIKTYSAPLILTVTGLSLLRYIIFTTQFILIMELLGVDLSLLIMVSGVTWIFLVKSIIPSFNFITDLGIREVSAVMFFENYLVDPGQVISATFIIWIVNILVPAIFGSIFIFYLKTIR
ncbi:MAG: lysylphosphatidylglycerol synthase domain-containing protein [Candidatus Cyclobacteriaceae bacterium M2_1C_046]